MNNLCSSSAVIFITCTIFLLLFQSPQSVHSLSEDGVRDETTTLSSQDSFDLQSESGEGTTENPTQDVEEEEPNDYVNTRTKTYADCQCGITNPGLTIQEIISQSSHREKRAGSKFSVSSSSAGDLLLEPLIIPEQVQAVYPEISKSILRSLVQRKKVDRTEFSTLVHILPKLKDYLDVCDEKQRKENHEDNSADSEGSLTNDSVNTCEVCKKSFSHRQTLLRHMRLHNGTSFDCTLCGKKFATQQQLVSHTRTHMAEAAGVREFPWLVAITKKKWDGRQHVVCGGSLVNSRFVVTAAHCIKNQPIGRMEVAFNVHNSTSMKEDREVEIRKIKRLIIHPGWNQQTVDNDIGLIELSAPIDFSQSIIRPICLPVNHNHSDFDGKNGTVAGWGYTTASGPNSNVLNKIVVPILSEKQCREETIYKDKILDSMLCAGYLEGGRDACTNDSGGPLIVQEGEKNVLVGLVSWGHGCARRLAPGVYTRVTRYVDWIQEKVTRGDWCQARRIKSYH